MTDQHPLTEERAAELWCKHAGDTVASDDWYGWPRRSLISLLRAAFDAGREHERTNPTPPAEEVELPGVPCVLTDVQFREVLAAGVALWTGLEAVVSGFAGRAVVVPASDLTAFTLPDGTRARRDGNHEDGTPRFVKVEDNQ